MNRCLTGLQSMRYVLTGVQSVRRHCRQQDVLLQSPWLQSQAPQQTDSSPDSDKIGISEKAVRMRNNLDLRIKSGVLTSLF